MPRPDYKRCKSCNRHADECGPLSHTRLCGACGQARLTENIVGLAEHRGQPLLRWRIGVVAAAGGVLLDDVRAKP